MMLDRELEEYRLLRTTIGARSTARVWVFVAGLTGWAALAATTSVIGSPPAVTLIPLLVLAGVFEAVFALHVSVERIGRYLQVFCDDRWENAAARLGPPMAGTGTDPLFTIFFGFATLLNFAPVVLAGPVAVEWVVLGAAHVVVIARIVFARQATAGQRKSDLARFEQIKIEQLKHDR
jgi:hypothetical protein